MASTASCYDLTDCVLMLHMDGTDGSTTFTDETGKAVTANGNAQIDTAQSVFGGASGLFDGTGDHLSLLDSADWDLGTGNFTIDFRVRFAAAVGANDRMIDRGADFYIAIRSDGNLRMAIEGTNYSFAWAPSTNTWYHVALVRSGNSLYAFVDGTQVGSTQDVTGKDIQGTTALGIGGEIASTGDLNGWMDEVRIVKGTAIWTSNFTPPGSAYTECSSSSSSSSCRSSSSSSSSSSSRSSSSSSCRSSSSSSSSRSSSSSSSSSSRSSSSSSSSSSRSSSSSSSSSSCLSSSSSSSSSSSKSSSSSSSSSRSSSSSSSSSRSSSSRSSSSSSSSSSAFSWSFRQEQSASWADRSENSGNWTDRTEQSGSWTDRPEQVAIP